LPRQIGFRALLDGGGDILHAFVAGRGAEHLLAGHEAIDHGQQAAEDGDLDCRHRIPSPIFSFRAQGFCP